MFNKIADSRKKKSRSTTPYPFPGYDTLGWYSKLLTAMFREILNLPFGIP
jgi:hypothetical protein